MSGGFGLAQVDPEPSEVQLPEVFYLELVETMPLTEWQMLTGLDAGTAEELAQAYKEVVRKKLQKGIRADFSDWFNQAGQELTPEQRQLAEQLLSKFAAVIELVTFAEEGDSLSATYQVRVEPQRETPLTPEQAPRASLMTGAFLFVAGGFATSLLVKKGVGLKVLAGVAGGAICVSAWGFFVNSSGLLQRREEGISV